MLRSAGQLPRYPIFRISPVRRYLSYDSTLKNLKIGSHTRVIFQGFTGKQATTNARESLKWGTNIVGGVTPGREGEHLGLPVLPSVRKAMEVLRPDATGIYVAAHQAVGAIEEAIEAEVPLIVAVAEHIPLHDFFRIYSMLQTQSTCRLLGANSPGIISAVGKCRIGFHPIPCFQPGRIGIVARSGTLSYETAASTLRAGLGQSMCIGIGGDMIPGTTLKEGLQILVEDDDTEGIAFIGEVGGYGELEAAEFIKSYRAQNKNPKPIAALVAGMQTVPGQPMGHAGAVSLLGEPSTATKLEALRAAGVAIVGHPSRFGPVLKSMIDATNVAASGSGISQRRGIHTVAHRPTSSQRALPRKTWCQRRSFYLSETALRLLRKRGLPIADSTTRQSSLPLEEEEETFLDLPQPQGPDIVDTSRPRRLVVTFNRSAKNPCIIAFHPDNNSEFEKFDFDYGAAAEDIPIEDIAFFQGLPLSSIPSLGKIVTGLVRLFKEKEAFQLSVEIRCKDSKDGLTMVITDAQLGFDDAAFRSGGRHADLQKLRTKLLEHTVESDGITYMKLAPPGNIGTLVNGAGLAMNTVDALAAAGGHAANFLDTGGKATSETVKRSFELILEDQDVKCIFVNIFGGLTRGDMIAEGIVLAFKDLRIPLPVVVRIRGTNEREGQRIIAESGLPLFAFDDFDEAAAKAIELANQE